jgi:hypothetical protein
MRPMSDPRCTGGINLLQQTGPVFYSYPLVRGASGA